MVFSIAYLFLCMLLTCDVFDTFR